jgi:hypothetical protein
VTGRIPAAGRSGAPRRVLAAAFLAVLLVVLPGMAAWGQSLCRGGETDDTPRPIPESLVPAAVRLFGLKAMPADQVRRSTLYRCVSGRVLVCNLGANLPCDKANTSRNLPAADAWCAEHPGSDFIPMYVTRHDAVYRWRCRGAQALAIGQPLDVDRRGFISRLWKPVDAAATQQK